MKCSGRVQTRPKDNPDWIRQTKVIPDPKKMQRGFGPDPALSSLLQGRRPAAPLHSLSCLCFVFSVGRPALANASLLMLIHGSLCVT